MAGEDEELDALWHEHREQTRARLATLRRVARLAASGRLDAAARAEGEREAHTLAGAAALFGFTAGARIAREIEALLAEDDTSSGSRATAGARLERLAAELALTLDRDRSSQGRPE